MQKNMLKSFCQGGTCTGDFQNRAEVLIPFIDDPLSIIPSLAVLLQLLINPRKINKITDNSIENHCVLPETITAMRR